MLGQNSRHFRKEHRVQFPVQSVVAVLHAKGHVTNDRVHGAATHRYPTRRPLHNLHIELRLYVATAITAVAIATVTATTATATATTTDDTATAATATATATATITAATATTATDIGKPHASRNNAPAECVRPSPGHINRGLGCTLCIQLPPDEEAAGKSKCPLDRNSADPTPTQCMYFNIYVESD
jgi:hypothetical protein